jgi:hypothetical protein
MAEPEDGSKEPSDMNDKDEEGDRTKADDIHASLKDCDLPKTGVAKPPGIQCWPPLPDGENGV